MTQSTSEGLAVDKSRDTSFLVLGGEAQVVGVDGIGVGSLN